jgi:hypothetical protein
MLFSGFAPPCETPGALTFEIRQRGVRSLFAALRRNQEARADGTPSAARSAGRAEDRRPTELRSEANVSDGVTAAAIEFGIALWSEFKTRPYARKLYSILWTLRHPPSAEQLLTRCEPCEVAFVREDTMMGFAAGAGDVREGGADLAALSSKLDALEAALKTKLTAPRRSCPRCGCRDMERIALQLRAADEGMTTMLQCTQCSQRIRI